MTNTFSKIILLILLKSLASQSSIAQSLGVTVSDNQKTFLAGATIQLTSMADSSQQFRISDPNGRARFEKVNQGVNQLRISYIGYQTLEKTVLVKNGEQNFQFQLESDVIALTEINVVARRPLIRQEDDKMIIDPEPIALMSTNTLEILETTPGLFVDPDGGIYLSSAVPASVFINGREQKMGTQDLMNLLRNLPPGSIQRIEVMRTPSAKYSASASGGIINIVLKKGMKIGRFGSANGGFNQGVYGNQFAGISMNNSGSRASEYLNFNVSNNNGIEDLNSSRLLRVDTALFQSAQTKRETKQAFLGYGISYELNEQFVLSYDGRLSTSLPYSKSDNNNLIQTSEKIAVSETQNLIENDSKTFNINQEFTLLFKLDTLGSELDTKFSFNHIRNDLSQQYGSNIIFPVTPIAFYISGKGSNEQRRSFFGIQSDLSYQLPYKLKFESGFNLGFQQFDSDTDFTRSQNDIQVPDPSRISVFRYRENINAGYLQLSRPLISKLLLKAGIRMEHTYMSGNQIIPSDTSFIVSRSDWFPYIYLSRPIISVAGFELRSFLIYRKTISRPAYQNLNPFVNYVDQFLYEAGNPALKPQFSDNMEVNISIDEMPIFAVGRTYTRDIFSSVVYQDANNPGILVRTYDNLGKNRETYFRAVGALPPGGKYFFVLGVQYNLNEYEGFYENLPLDYRRGSWRWFSFHSLRIGTDTRLTMSGFMMTGGQFNFYELGPFGMLNFGLNQTFLNKKLNITLNARDVLRTMINDFELKQGNVVTSGSRYSDNRRFGINIRYNFGISDRKEKQNMMQFDGQE